MSGRTDRIGKLLLRVWGCPEAKVAAALSVLTSWLIYAMSGPAETTLLREHLGGEYYNIARAIVDGRGFSDPFGEATGPTAWMPPLYPIVLATLLGGLGSRSMVAAAVMLLTAVTVVVTGTTVYAIASRTRYKLSPLFALAFYAAWVIVFRRWFFVLTHDVWLLVLIVNVVMVMTWYQTRTSKLPPWSWGVAGGVAALASPVLAFAWGALWLVFLAGARGNRKRWLLAAGIATLIVAPWTARNAWVFRDFIPMKSNFAFDLYQANYVDDDGVFDERSMSVHPLSHMGRRFVYARDGERRFIERYRSLAARALREKPDELIERIVNRLLACTLAYLPESEDQAAISSSDAGVVAALMDEGNQQRMMFRLPFLLLLCAFWLPGQHRQVLLTAALLYGSFLLPYVLVAFYERYFFPLTPVLVLITFLGADQLVAQFAAVRIRRSAA
jgi:hypothetical protein